MHCAGGASEAEQARLADFGWNLGMAFQFVDDILDFTSRESILGKPVGNDLREGKVTLPLIYALAASTADERERVAMVLKDRSYERVSFSEVLDLVSMRGGIDRAKQRASEFTAKARTLISEFPPGPAQRSLLAVTDLVADRDR